MMPSSTGLPGEELVDITSLIDDCAASLTLSNPILCDEENFSLHDSMAALEIMDHKMDCCELPGNLVNPHNDPDVSVPPRRIPSGLDDEIAPLPWNTLTIQDATDIGLEILIRLEALLSGASVAESTYTCLYAHNAVLCDMRQRLHEQPSSLTEQFGALLKIQPAAQMLVYAQVLALVEISDVVRSIILHADIYEEEDFSINTFGLQPYPDTNAAQTILFLEDAIQVLRDMDEENVEELYLMLSFEVKFLLTCTSLAKLTDGPIHQLTHDAKAVIESGVKNLEQLQIILDSRVESNDSSPSRLIAECFDSFVYRPLVGSSPVRKVSFRRPEESVKILSKILSDMSWAVCDTLLFGSSLLYIRRMLNRVSVSSVNILSRSLIVLNLYFDDRLLGQHLIAYLIGRDIEQMAGIPSALLGSKYSRAFLSRLAKPVYDTLKLLVLNRNRQRTYMEVVMFNDWSSLQQEAHIVDANHGQEFSVGVTLPPYFTQYTLYFTILLMEHYVALGIELSLFVGQHDLSTAFWYRDFLLASLLNTMSSLRNFKGISKQIEETFGKSAIRKSNGQIEPTVEELHCEMDMIIIDLKRNLCRGLVKVCG
jgi:hypothetical protein